MDGGNPIINGSQPRDVGQETSVSVAMASLLQHLTLPGGSQISTSGAYRFAIVAYDPRDEFEMRRAASRLQAQMTTHGWTVIAINLQELFLSQLRTLGDRTVQRLIDKEKRQFARLPERAFANIQESLLRVLEPPNGLADACSRLIKERMEEVDADPKRTLVVLSHLGFLYPLFSASSLLTYLDGHTGDASFVMLYPGQKRGDNGLSFMGRREPDTSYRCRIY